MATGEDLNTPDTPATEGWTMTADGEFVWCRLTSAPGLEVDEDRSATEQLGLATDGAALATRMIRDRVHLVIT